MSNHMDSVRGIVSAVASWALGFGPWMARWWPMVLWFALLAAVPYVQVRSPDTFGGWGWALNTYNPLKSPAFYNAWLAIAIICVLMSLLIAWRVPREYIWPCLRAGLLAGVLDCGLTLTLAMLIVWQLRV
jgi:hypothetical protein